MDIFSNFRSLSVIISGIAELPSNSPDPTLKQTPQDRTGHSVKGPSELFRLTPFNTQIPATVQDKISNLCSINPGAALKAFEEGKSTIRLYHSSHDISIPYLRYFFSGTNHGTQPAIELVVLEVRRCCFDYEALAKSALTFCEALGTPVTFEDKAVTVSPREIHLMDPASGELLTRSRHRLADETTIQLLSQSLATIYNKVWTDALKAELEKASRTSFDDGSKLQHYETMRKSGLIR